MSKNNKLIKVILILVIAILSIILLIKLISDIAVFIKNPGYSVPWYLPVIIDLILFMIPILTCVVLLFIICKRNKREGNSHSESK